MGRRRGGGGGFSRSPPPQTRSQSGAPPPSTRRGDGGGSSLFGAVANMVGQGMMWGAGSSIGHRAVDGVMGPRTIAYGAHEQHKNDGVENSASGIDARANPCAAPMELFGKCLEQNSDNVAQCQAFADLLTSCKRDQMQ